jgi:hypothetical protein
MDYFEYGYSFGEALMAVIGVLIVVGVLISIVELALYILRAIGVMTMAGRRGLQNAWMVWIPVVGVYTIGQIADDIQAREGNRTYFRWLLLGGQLVSFVLSVVSGYAAVSNFMGMIESFNSYGYGDSPYSMVTPFYMFMNLLGGPASLIGFGVYIITLISLYYIYKCYKPESSTAYTVLSVIFPFLQSIFPFILRNNQPHWLNPPPYYGVPPYAPGGYPPPPPPPNFGQPPYGGYPGQGQQQPNFEQQQPPEQGQGFDD